MDLITEYVDPQELTGFVRAALADREVNQFTLSNFLTSKNVDDTEYRLARGGDGLVEAGTYRAWDTESPLIDRPGITRIMGALAPISLKARVGEYVRLKQRQLTGEVRDAIFNDARRLTQAVAARVELARGDALVNGSVTISDENGVSQTVNFGRSGSMSVTPASAAWDAASSPGDPIQDLVTWFNAYVDENGSEPGVILTSRKVLAVLQSNPKVHAYAFPNGANVPASVTPVDVNRVLNAYGLPSIETYDAKVTVDGASTRVIDDAKLLMLPARNSQDSAQLGNVLWGTTAESLEADYAGVGEGIVAGTYSKRDPISLYTHVAAVNMPVLANPNLAMVADVLT